MFRATCLALISGVATADLATECMKGLEVLDAQDDVELAVRCRAAYGPEVCRQARQALGAQPWTHARMKTSCAHFARAYTGMESRTLEEVVSSKDHPQRGLAMPMDEAMQYKTENGSPIVASAVGPVGPVADLLAKLQTTTETDASSDEEEAVKEAKVVHDDVAQAGNSTKDLEKIEVQAANSSKEEEDKHEAANVAETSNTTKVAEASPSPVPAKSEESKNGEASQEVEEAKQEVEPKTEGGQVPAVVKLFGDAEMSKRQVGEPQTFRFFGAFAAAAALSAFALLLGSRRSRPAQGSHVLLDLEREVE